MRASMISGAVVAAVPGAGIDINAILTILLGAAGGGVLWKIVLLVLDKLVPSRTDKRSDVEASFSVLSNTIQILSNEKTADSAALSRANQRIKDLEAEGAEDYNVMRALREAKDDLEMRIQRKDEHIAELTRRLAEFGAKVTFDAEGRLHIDSSHVNTGPIPTV